MAGNEWINGYLEAILAAGRTRYSTPQQYFLLDLVTLLNIFILLVRRGLFDDEQLEIEGIQRMSARQNEQEKVRREATEDLSEDLDEGEKGDIVGELMPSGTPKKKFQRNFSDLSVWSDENKEKKLYIVLISVHGLVRGENMELGSDSDTGGQVKYVVELARALAMMPGVYRVDLFTRQVSSPDVDWSYGEPTEMLTSGSHDAEGSSESGGAYIVRIPCGQSNKYIKKESLWPYLQEFVDGALAHILNMSKVLGEQVGHGKPVLPYVIHGHYADAGDVAALLSGALNVPMVLTGHSLGRNKLEQIMMQGRMSKEEIDATYKIMRRIEGEELALDAAELVITSTRQEIDEQWGLYDGFDVKLEKVLRARTRRGLSCHGRFMPRMMVIPPGMDFSNVVVQDIDGDGDKDDINLDAASPRSLPPIWAEVMRFLTNPHKPMILALSRPDPKKNITTLVKAFGECRPLRELANLVLIMGNRDDIEEMPPGNANVLTTVLKLVDKYDLYGSVAFPKHHKQADVPEIYRLTAKTKGVFINPALVEPFGLTLIEAAAHGLPIVATKNGGPVDITNTLNSGLLVDPHDQNAIADALLKLVADKNLWHECRKNGLRNIHLYSWPEHCRTYLARVAGCRIRNPRWLKDTPADAGADDEAEDSLMEFQDLSLRLSIDGERGSTNEPASSDPQDQVQKIMNKLHQSSSAAPDAATDKNPANVHAAGTVNKDPLPRRRRPLVTGKKMLQVIQEVFRAVRSDTQLSKISGFALSTAMPLSETLQLLQTGKVPPTDFDALICGSGSEVYYPGSAQCLDAQGKLRPDQDYLQHINHRWSHDGARQTIGKLMASQDGSGSVVEPDVESCNAHCVSFFVRDPKKVRTIDEMRERLRMRGLRCHLMYCRNSTRMQVVPLMASRSQALRYLFVRWGLPVGNMYIVLGEHGDTDREEMLSGLHKTVIVKGVTEKGSEDLLRSSGSYHKEDVVPSDSPLATTTRGDLKSDEILRALKEVSKASSG
ncbi:Sucrose-phosphate synthase [Triticum urartu]|uniref:Sucrose-phosphate synthase n=1 Tax=Triticum urartu TaxID=4572 RepID=M8B299_TRIUA|nr:Sucrose-phosphate synthase [Triticum urartu]